MKVFFAALLVAMFAFAPVQGEAKVIKKHTKQIEEKVVMRAPEPPKNGPSDVISTFYRSLTDVMKEGETLGFAGRYQKLEPAVDAAFSSADMTRVSYGPSWVKASPEQQDKLVHAFRNFTVANYANEFKKLDGEVFTVKGEKQGPTENQRIVQTTLQSGADTHELNYLMVKTENGWKIADVFVDGTISEMATRRSEFGSVIRTGGPEALATTLEQKTKLLSE